MRPRSESKLRVAYPVGQHAFAVVAAGEHAQRAGLHRAELAGVDEERLALAVTATRCLRFLPALVAGEEPEAGGDAGGQEELGRQRDNAVHQVGLDDALADFALAAGAGRERAVGHDEAGDSAAVPVRRGQVVDEVLNPGVVGIADGRPTVAPAHVVGQQLARPIRDIERRIGEDVVGLEVWDVGCAESCRRAESQRWLRCRG